MRALIIKTFGRLQFLDLKSLFLGELTYSSEHVSTNLVYLDLIDPGNQAVVRRVHCGWKRKRSLFLVSETRHIYEFKTPITLKHEPLREEDRQISKAIVISATLGEANAKLTKVINNYK